ncbi:unnamed protein product [Linum tenue]|uniref:Tetratricopeptide repeat (TPR)-like superfamily protein n=1 Tax=Linum tenue TaxID=586396 RepID=A0AAV0HKW0_9ROSI|nr:unnamed protein product [Linum tenue]
MQVSSCLLKNLSQHGGSLLWYLRGLSVHRWSISYALLFCALILSVPCLRTPTCPIVHDVWIFVDQVVKLYERCLIACANYPEYWTRYVLCMEACGSMDIADNALVRATQVFVKRQPDIHLFAARFREQNADIPGARAAYERVHTEIAPGLLEAIIKHANMEYRLGNLETTFSLYEQAIAIEKGKDQSQVLPMLYAQYSRFVYLASGNAEKAREILVTALDHVPFSKPLLEALIHLESIMSLPKRIDYLDSLVDKFIAPSSDSTASPVEREELSCIFLEFLSVFGDVQSIKKAEDRHAKLFLPHRSKSELKKRHAEDYLSSDKSKVAKSYTDSASPAQSVMGAYPNAQQTQWPAGYGVQPQGWPPATQAQPQVQQWGPGYTQVSFLPFVLGVSICHTFLTAGIILVI